jgi:murein peptide amidase A
MKILKKIYSKNNNEIMLVNAGDFCPEGQKSPAKNALIEQSRSGILARQHKTILIIGVVHGEEPQGKFLIENYLNCRAGRPDLLRLPRPLRERVGVRGKNRLLFIPCLNPDGLAQNKRQNVNGVDLNRNFPTANWEKTDKNSEYYGGENSASEIETKFLIEILAEFSPDLILTIHAPYKVVNYDGPAEETAQKISEIISYPVSKDIGYPTPGSLGTYAGVERNIPTITLELDEEATINDLQEPFNKICDYLACFIK